MELTIADQLQSAQRIAMKFMSGKKKDSKRLLMQKLEQTLIRKGFTTDIIQEIKNTPSLTENVADELETLRLHGDKARRKFAKFSNYEFNQKMKQFLYRKGFAMEYIDQYLEEITNEE
jgi:regulatory protein